MENRLLNFKSRMRITGPGLTTIAMLTAILWGCIFLEQRTLIHARAGAERAISDIHALQLKKHLVPAATQPAERQSARPQIG